MSIRSLDVKCHWSQWCQKWPGQAPARRWGTSGHRYRKIHDIHCLIYQVTDHERVVFDYPGASTPWRWSWGELNRLIDLGFRILINDRLLHTLDSCRRHLPFDTFCFSESSLQRFFDSDCPGCPGTDQHWTNSIFSKLLDILHVSVCCI